MGTYCEIPFNPLCYIKSSDISKALKSTARIHGTEFGIGPDDVSDGCLRSTGAMALFCGSVDRSRIRLLGRWQSWNMLRYLHLQSRLSMRRLFAAMLQGDKIDMLPPRAAYLQFFQILQTSWHASLECTVNYMRRCEALPTHPSSWGKYWDFLKALPQNLTVKWLALRIFSQDWGGAKGKSKLPLNSTLA